MKKHLSTILLIVCVFAISAGATLAYLTDETDAVKNTFVVGEIGDLSLDETATELDDDENDRTNSYIVIPGQSITKDPTVTFTYENDSNDCSAYVYVTVTSEGWTRNGNEFTSSEISDAMRWSVDSAWTYLSSTGDTHVFYILVEPTEGHVNKSVISEDTISVSGELITEKNIESLSGSVSDLEFKAYAIQADGFTDAASAWDALTN